MEKVAKLEPVNQDVFYHLSKAYGQLAKQFFGSLQKEFADSHHIHLARAHLHLSKDGRRRKSASSIERFSKAQEQERATLSFMRALVASSWPT